MTKQIFALVASLILASSVFATATTEHKDEPKEGMMKKEEMMKENAKEEMTKEDHSHNKQ